MFPESTVPGFSIQFASFLDKNPILSFQARKHSRYASLGIMIIKSVRSVVWSKLEIQLAKLLQKECLYVYYVRR